MNSGGFSFVKLIPLIVLVFGVIELLHEQIYPWNLGFAAVIFLMAALMVKKAFIDSRETRAAEREEAVETSMPSFAKPKPKPQPKPAPEKTDASKINLEDFLVSSPDSLKEESKEEEEELPDFEIEEEEEELEPEPEEKPAEEPAPKPRAETAEEKKEKLEKDFEAPKKEDVEKVREEALKQLKSLAKKKKSSGK